MKNTKIDYLFEVSWEVCNKVGGIHTVIATKIATAEKYLCDNYILIGPYLEREGRNQTEFEEDKSLFKTWRKILDKQGIKVKVGRWLVAQKPLAILVDFSSLMSQKNDILSELWTDYKVDSISGSLEYIESAVFGYASAQVIKSFYAYHLNIRQNVVAHYHEWLTGSGVLFLKKYAPQVSTVFTTHATTLGRSIAGNNYPLYSIMSKVNGDSKAKEINVTAKHSIEKATAQAADIFTTVSNITAEETKYLLEKEVDIVTPNGFDDSIVPEGNNYTELRTKAHDKLTRITENLLGYKLKNNTKFISTSGRYEYKNKGIDVFLDVMATLNQSSDFTAEIVSFILVPANNYGARKDLLEKLQNNSNIELENKFLTHNLHDAEFDAILKRIQELNFTNNADQKVKVIFVPAYLNGNDGIFNLSYYDLLPAFDLTIFPSYYEPWGYTPLESLAFHVPTITSTLAGFGRWILDTKHELSTNCINVIERTDDNYHQSVEDIVKQMIYCSHQTVEEIENSRKKALELSKVAQWKNLITYYKEAYLMAIDKSRQRKDNIDIKSFSNEITEVKDFSINEPKWHYLNVIPNMPSKLSGLSHLAKNLWWAWNSDAQELFEMADETLWEATEHNPIKLLKEISYTQLEKLEKDQEFIIKYQHVYQNFLEYINKSPRQDLPKIAYFSMEYGIANTLKIFSGGLGILAGDYLKQASDKNINLVAVGLMYKYGYFNQKLSIKGEQIVSYDAQDYANLPIELVSDDNNKPMLVTLGLPGRKVYLQIWKVPVGRISLYLLDSDIDKNKPEDRPLTHNLYGGDNEHRLKQELVLGIGGIRALNQMNIHSNVYHSNEGHSAFIGIERINQYMNKYRLTFAEAYEIIRSSTLFTTHTPVAAGHDVFPEDLIMTYLGHYPERLKISWQEFLKLGKINVLDKKEKFSMSYLAANLSQEINGVSYLHGEVTKNLFSNLWKAYYPQELHIGYVTNGVHYPSWAAPEWKKVLKKHIGVSVDNASYDHETWNKVYDISATEIWKIRNKLRSDLVNLIKNRINTHFVRRRKNPQQIVAIQNSVNEKILTIGFARRFATYKRASLLFNDRHRLAALLNNPDKPVQIIFAGKAHPADGQGHELIQKINELSMQPEFIGKIIFLENYDIDLAKKMVQGVDVWLNTPTRPLEASGTSGMKAVMNGVLNLSVLDGWWVEGFKENAGWALPLEKTYDNQEFQNQLDAEMIYEILENEVIPMFYNRDDKDIPTQWIQFIKKNLALIAPDFTMARMLDDYINKFYLKLASRKRKLRENDFALANQLSAWKKRMRISWDSVVNAKIDVPKEITPKMITGEKYAGNIKIDLNDINPENIGLEVIMVEEKDNKTNIIQTNELELVDYNDNIASFRIEFKPTRPGVFKYAFRIYLKNKLLPHRLDFPIAMWL